MKKAKSVSKLSQCKKIKNVAVYGKSVVAEMLRPISKKEIDDVLREWAEARIRGKRAVCCIPLVPKKSVLVMPTEEYAEYIKAVAFAGFGKFAWDKDAPTRTILGMNVVIDDNVKRIIARPNDLPKAVS